MKVKICDGWEYLLFSLFSLKVKVWHWMVLEKTLNFVVFPFRIVHLVKD